MCINEAKFSTKSYPHTMTSELPPSDIESSETFTENINFELKTLHWVASFR